MTTRGESAPGVVITPPTQWATRRLVTLRVRCLVFLVAVAGAFRMGIRCRMVIFSEPTRTSLTRSRRTRWRSGPLELWATGATGAGSQLGEESFQVIGEFEAGLLIGELGVQGIELTAQVSLAGPQVRHPGPQLIDGDQLLLERLDHAGAR